MGSCTRTSSRCATRSRTACTDTPAPRRAPASQPGPCSLRTPPSSYPARYPGHGTRSVSALLRGAARQIQAPSAAHPPACVSARVRVCAHCPSSQLVISVAALLGLARVVEPVYGSKEFLKFIAVVCGGLHRLRGTCRQSQSTRHDLQPHSHHQQQTVQQQGISSSKCLACMNSTVNRHV